MPTPNSPSSRDALAAGVEHVKRLFVPSLFIGVRPYLVIIVLLVAAAIVAQGMYGKLPQTAADWNSFEPKWREIGIFTAGTFAGLLLIGAGLWFLGKVARAKDVCPADAIDGRFDARGQAAARRGSEAARRETRPCDQAARP